MAKLIEARPANDFYSESTRWLIADRFEVTIFIEQERSDFFITDLSGKNHPLKLTPKIAEFLGLNRDPEIKLTPSIDTCGINVPTARHDEIFKKIEEYLLQLRRLLVAGRFELFVFTEKKGYTFFIDDLSEKNHPLKLTPKIAEFLGLNRDPEIKLTPSIDTCGINVPTARYDEIFTKIEGYLLQIDRYGISFGSSMY